MHRSRYRTLTRAPCRFLTRRLPFGRQPISLTTQEDATLIKLLTPSTWPIQSTPYEYAIAAYWTTSPLACQITTHRFSGFRDLRSSRTVLIAGLRSQPRSGRVSISHFPHLCSSSSLFSYAWLQPRRPSRRSILQLPFHI